MPPLSIRSNSPPTTPNVSNLSRLSATNGELTITTSHGPISSHNLKRSPSSLSPNCTDNSTADLLVDSPSKSYIPTQCFLFYYISSRYIIDIPT